MNTLRLADEVHALRNRVAELERSEKINSKYISDALNQNVTDAKNIREIDRAYNAHLDRGH